MEITEETFKRSLPIQIRFNDIDAVGHINNNIYYSYYDLGKINYLACIQEENVSWIESQIVIARTETDFYLPVFYKENIAVETKVTHLGNKSGTFLQQIRNTDTNQIKSRCKSVFVTFNIKKNRSEEIPQIWKTAISEFESLTL